MGIFKRNIVGMEIDSKEIRVVHMEGTPDKPVFRAFASQLLEKGVVKEGKVVKPDKLGTAISMLWTREKIKCRDVILGINNQDIIVRFATLPKLPKDKLENLIRFQSTDYIPVSFEDIELDYSVIGEVENDSGGVSLKVLLVAGRKNMLFDFLDAFKKARLNLNDIAPSMLSMDKLLPKEVKGHSVAVINLSQDFGNIVLYDHNAPGMARSFGYPVDILPVMTSFTDKKHNTGIASFDNGTIEAMCQFLAGEIRTSVQYYRNQNAEADFQHIILTGGISSAKGLVDHLQQLMDTNVTLLDVPVSPQINEKPSPFYASDYSICIGLAIRGLEVQ